MESLVRLVPFLRRRLPKLIISVVLGCAVAGLWTATLLYVFPVVKLLLREETLHTSVAAELKSARSEVDRLTARETDLLKALKLVETSDPTNGHDLPDKSSIQRDLKRCQQRVRQVQSKIWWNELAETRLIPHLPSDSFQLLALLLTTFMVVTIIKAVASYHQEVLVGSVVEQTMQELRERLFRKTLELDQQTLALETTPGLMSRFTNDLQQVSLGLTLLGSKVVVEPLKIILCVGVALAVNWRLTLLSFVFAPVAALLFVRLGKTLKKASRRQMEGMSRIYRTLTESLGSFRTVIGYGNERLHRRTLVAENRDYYRQAMRIVRIDALANPSVELLATAAIFVASLPGAYLVLRQKEAIWGIRLTAEPMSVADLSLLYALMGGILDPARRLSSLYSKVKKASVASSRLFQWMDKQSLLPPVESPIPVPRHSIAIDFDSVTFRYAAINPDEVRSPALVDVSVKIPFGSSVAIVGGNGSGKSTLVNLLPRFFDPDSGSVCIDGVDLQTVRPRDVRSQLGVVTQETLLFDRTIAENIAFGSPAATPADIETAARQARVLDFANQIPGGLNAQVGPKGQRLSGGQRQRIALARAFVRDPAILILDEATSAIDVQSEQLIYEALREFAQGRTTLIVTHALTHTLLELVTHVLVMEAGRAIAFGSHEDVLATCPAYRRLLEAQSHRRAA